MMDIFEKISLDQESIKKPKNLTKSIRRKYKRRLNNLSYAVDEYISYAEKRLENPRIRNTKETEKILKKALELKNVLHMEEEIIYNESDFTNLKKVFT